MRHHRVLADGARLSADPELRRLPLTGPDSFWTQWWGGQPTFEAATPIAITPPQIVTGIDASLAAPETPSTTPSAVPVVTKPLLQCKRGFVKRKVHGKRRCVKRHNAKSNPRHKQHDSRLTSHRATSLAQGREVRSAFFFAVPRG